MRIIGIMVCGAGESERYLQASLEELKRLCDDVVVVGNNTDKKTEEMIRAFDFWFYRDDREWGLYQPDIKTDLLKKVGGLNPDWIIALDADEVFAPEFTREEAEKLASQDEIAWYFMIINLYNDYLHYAHDVGIQKFWNIRFYKYMPEHGLEFQKTRVHCGLAPPVAYKYGWHAPYYVEHYGLMKPEDRAKKAERYQIYDPQARFKGRAYYDDLVRDLEMKPFDRKRTLIQLAESVDCQPRKRPRL